MSAAPLIPVLLGLVLAGCAANRPPNVTPPSPAPPAPPAPVTLPAAVRCVPAEPLAGPPPDPRVPALRRGDEAYESGDLASAAAAYDAYLATDATPEEIERVLVRLVVLCTLPPTRDPVAARDYHQRLVVEFPASTYRAEADLVLRASTEGDNQRRRIQELEKEVARLKQVVEKLKEIDLAPRKPPG